MSFDAVITQAMGRIDASVEKTADKVAKTGNKMQESLRKVGNQASETASKFSMAQRGLINLSKGFAAGLGFGSIDMIGGTALRYIQEMRAEIERERQERVTNGANFTEGTRSLLAANPLIREQLTAATPQASATTNRWPLPAPPAAMARPRPPSRNWLP